jgi:hypothetical protein
MRGGQVHLMPAPVHSYAALELGRKACGRS